MLEVVISVRLEQSLGGDMSFNNDCHMLNLVYAANVYAFCLRTSKDSSMGEFDESLISVFNRLFESVLFRFYVFLFPFKNYFTSIVSYLISGTNI